MKYFAYGSNMNQEQMKKRCPESTFLGKGVLSGYKIAFTTFSKTRNCGCADIVYSPDDEVWGLLYEISDSDRDELDKAEGHPKKYKRCEVTVKDQFGVVSVVETYEVVTKDLSVKPSKDYLKLIQDAAHKFDFPRKYQAILASVGTSD